VAFLAYRFAICWKTPDNPSPASRGRIKEGAKGQILTEKRGLGFCYPPLNPLPLRGRGDGRGNPLPFRGRGEDW